MENIKREKKCHFCVNNLEEVDYKDINTLKKFVNYHQKILSGKRTGTCARHQRKLSQAIKRARVIALMPFTAK
jgi:small subunit ribosomal protein S18